MEAAVAAETETNTTERKKETRKVFLLNFLEEKLCGSLKIVFSTADGREREQRKGKGRMCRHILK